MSWGNKFSALLLVVFLYFIPGVIAFRRRFGFSYPIVSRTFALGLGFLFFDYWFGVFPIREVSVKRVGCS